MDNLLILAGAAAIVFIVWLITKVIELLIESPVDHETDEWY